MHAHARKHAHTAQYVILIAFPQQQWLRERASVLRYTFFACLVRSLDTILTELSWLQNRLSSTHVLQMQCLQSYQHNFLLIIVASVSVH